MLTYASYNRMSKYFLNNPDYRDIDIQSDIADSLGEAFLPLYISLSTDYLCVKKSHIDGIFYREEEDRIIPYRKIIKAETDDIFLDRDLLNELAIDYPIKLAIFRPYYGDSNGKVIYDLDTPVCTGSIASFRLYLERLYDELVE